MLSKALVPLDGTELAEGILPFVTQIAKGMNMPLVLFSVVDPDAIELPGAVGRSETPDIVPLGQPGGVATTSMRGEGEATRDRERAHVSARHEGGEPHATQIFDSVRDQVKERLEAKAAELRKLGLKVEVAVEFGHAAEQIVEAAKAKECDLIAMSTHGRTMIGRGILGSVTDKVLHASLIPTLTITPDRAEAFWQENEPITRIILPLDGSPLAEEAIPYVVKLARAMSLKVILVRVNKIGGIYAAYADGYPYVGSVDIEQEIENDSIEYLQSAASRLKAAGVEVEWKLLKGNPTAAIVEIAHDTSQSIIALTTHGRSGFTRWMLGSVAEGLVRASGDPVLVIPQQGE
jgi:nucleotide-binding universal stress UspA family protein